MTHPSEVLREDSSACKFISAEYNSQSLCYAQFLCPDDNFWQVLHDQLWTASHTVMSIQSALHLKKHGREKGLDISLERHTEHRQQRHIRKPKRKREKLEKDGGTKARVDN